MNCLWLKKGKAMVIPLDDNDESEIICCFFHDSKYVSDVFFPII